jgi:hypothetical protein
MMDESKTPPTHLGSCRYLTLYRWGFGFVHRSRTIFYHEVPSPNLTIPNFFHRSTSSSGGASERSSMDEELWEPFPQAGTTRSEKPRSVS